MKPEFETLRQLAKMAVEAPATKEGLARIADSLRDALDVSQVHFVYTADKDWVACGDTRCGDDVGTKAKGLWLVQQQAEIQRGPIAFNIRDRLVQDLTSAVGAKGRAYVGLRVPTSESPS